ncbi:MAG: hypothetical protein GYB68_15200 [Chloroflexi bacterium]|nr:hypothetical protein [Chloroflexota bacterium]
MQTPNRNRVTVSLLIVAALALLAAPLAVTSYAPVAAQTDLCNNTTAQYVEVNGFVFIETESIPSLSGQWELRTDNSGRFSDFTGDGYLFYAGNGAMGSPVTDGRGGLLEYTVQINTPGEYMMRWRSVVGEGNNNTEANDTWLRIPEVSDEKFYARDDDNPGSIVYPKGTGLTPVPEGGGGDGFFKVYGANSDGWSYSGRTYDNNAHSIFVQIDEPGIYTLQLSGRSTGHAIDRITLFRVNIDPQSSDNINRQTRDEREIAEDTTINETICDDGGTPPPATPPVDNLLEDGSFESATQSGALPNDGDWLAALGSSPLVYLETAGQVNDGAAALLLTGGGVTGAYQDVAVADGAEGDTWTLDLSYASLNPPSGSIMGGRINFILPDGSEVLGETCTASASSGQVGWAVLSNGGACEATVGADAADYTAVRVYVGWFNEGNDGFGGIDAVVLSRSE